MSRSILIVDDDKEFSGLLTSVFEQADYRVFVSASAKDAFSTLQNESVDLVVTDQRLPGMSGLDFVRQLEEMEIRLPVIMVSGYLEDDSIRQLIRSGISGIFMKPLNIFSLLKKASDLLKNQAALAAHADALAGGEEAEAMPKIAGIRGASEAGREFLRKAMESRDFKRQLLLIGPPGTLFDEVGQDLAGLASKRNHVVALRGGSIEQDRLGDVAAKVGTNQTTLVVMNAEKLTVAEIDSLEQAVDGGAGRDTRMLLCLQGSVEELYDRGVIDEDLYLFFGTAELRVPALKEMPEDVAEIVQDLIEESGAEVRMDPRLRSFLGGLPLEENMVELRSLALKAINLASPLPPQLKHFETACRAAGVAGSEQKAGGDSSPLERFLRQEKARYVDALAFLKEAAQQ